MVKILTMLISSQQGSELEQGMIKCWIKTIFNPWPHHDHDDNDNDDGDDDGDDGGVDDGGIFNPGHMMIIMTTKMNR